MDALLDLQAASSTTGQPVRRLRSWCATGRLACERDGEGWKLPLSQVLRVAVLAAERKQSIADGRPAAAIVPRASAPADLGGEVAERLGLPRSKVVVRTLALDGREYAMAAWNVADLPHADLRRVVEFVERLGGDILDSDAGEA